MSFATSYPDVTSAIMGPRTMDQLDDLLVGASLTLGDDTLDTIDAIVPPGTDISPPDVSCAPPSLTRTNPRRRPPHDRAAA
jgi:aryl-alcohol dehydrogenase (NADP+)